MLLLCKAKLFISCHHLAIETGPYTRPITPRNKYLCRSCSTNAPGDEFHFLLICPYLKKTQWKLLFTKLYEFYDIKNYGDHHTFIKLMHCCHGDVEVATLVCNNVIECLTLWCPSTVSLSCYQVNHVTSNFYVYIVFYCLSHFGLSSDVCWLVCVCVLFIACQFSIYRKTSSISRTKSQNINVSCILLQLCPLNPLKPGVGLRMKM